MLQASNKIVQLRRFAPCFAKRIPMRMHVARFAEHSGRMEIDRAELAAGGDLGDISRAC
jgi:hypothetical protein